MSTTCSNHGLSHTEHPSLSILNLLDTKGSEMLRGRFNVIAVKVVDDDIVAGHTAIATLA